MFAKIILKLGLSILHRSSKHTNAIFNTNANTECYLSDCVSVADLLYLLLSRFKGKNTKICKCVINTYTYLIKVKNKNKTKFYY